MPPAPSTPFGPEGVHRDGDLLWVPLRGRWLNAAHQPEELVRQEWIHRLHTVGGYALEQLDQERRTVHGRRSPRADIVVWSSVEAKQDGASPVMVVETKAGRGPIQPADYWQGESYARASGARFLLWANETAFLASELVHAMPGRTRHITTWPTLADLADSARLQRLLDELEVFDREQFQRVLFECHTLLRDNHAMTPDRAFDTISKILFIKLRTERQQNLESFTTDYLRRSREFLSNSRLEVHEELFNLTKAAFAEDDLFADDDRLGISETTFSQIVGKLERFNLSKTGEDVKGIAFERFLGRTFRGELGQFFTPRPVVDFIVDMLDPREGEIICDPAAGSGGFLIRAFEHVRERIISEVQEKRDAAIEAISAEYPDDASEQALAERDARVARAVADITAELATTGVGNTEADTRLGRLAWRSIYGTDKEPRAARTAKMNMIMHGDGHGGIHWHDGLIDTHGVFEGRFDVVITNPPFGATVSNAQVVGATPETDVPDDPAYLRSMQRRYGTAWRAAHDRVVAARRTPILESFDIGRGAKSRKTEQLFLERCLRLLRPGGRMGIVLPNGNLNAASQAWLRRWVEGQAFLQGVVALPAETFRFSGASVTASVLFLRKFTDEDAERWERCWQEAVSKTEASWAQQRDAAVAAAVTALESTGDAELDAAITKLAEFGVHPDFPVSTTPMHGLVRSADRSSVRGVSWEGAPRTGEVGVHIRSFTRRAADVPAVAAALATLRTALRRADDARTSEMWAYVRDAFDYPVFMAAPSAVGITATGDTGSHVPNDLPEILAAWKSAVKP
ncbi:N-6 DNA methylase [Microbacterium sp. NPDC090007]|uniref:N-6 DNA methylase n=1 Tax=Microbacterium sp. NPDC090007 TaxID=3364204 RepID=UPI003818909C